MRHPRLLIACIGNIFLGDDAFGVEVARRLISRQWPDDVRIVDFGIRGIDLVFALMEGYEAVILVDAAPCGQAPGTLYVIEPNPAPTGANTANAFDSSDPTFQAHNMDPAKVLQTARAMGAAIERLVLVGCEPQPIRCEHDIQTGLSPPARAAVEQALPLIESLVDDLLVPRHEPTGNA